MIQGNTDTEVDGIPVFQLVDLIFKDGGKPSSQSQCILGHETRPGFKGITNAAEKTVPHFLNAIGVRFHGDFIIAVHHGFIAAAEDIAKEFLGFFMLNFGASGNIKANDAGLAGPGGHGGFQLIAVADQPQLMRINDLSELVDQMKAGFNAFGELGIEDLGCTNGEEHGFIGKPMRMIE